MVPSGNKLWIIGAITDKQAALIWRKVAFVRRRADRDCGSPCGLNVAGRIRCEKDLNRYKLADNAKIRVFKPNTINSSFMILIPSEDTLPDSAREEVPFFLKSSSEDERQAKVDLYLTDDRDLNFTSSGDIHLIHFPSLLEIPILMDNASPWFF